MYIAWVVLAYVKVLINCPVEGLLKALFVIIGFFLWICVEKISTNYSWILKRFQTIEKVKKMCKIDDENRLTNKSLLTFFFIDFNLQTSNEFSMHVHNTLIIEFI